MPERMSDRMSECAYAYIYIFYFQMECQKLCQNSGSGWGSLEESNLFVGWTCGTCWEVAWKCWQNMCSIWENVGKPVTLGKQVGEKGEKAENSQKNPGLPTSKTRRQKQYWTNTAREDLPTGFCSLFSKLASQKFSVTWGTPLKTYPAHYS